MMKIEVGRVYVLLDEHDTYFDPRNDGKPQLVKLIVVDGFHGEKPLYVAGVESTGGILHQHVEVTQLKPASEKQRVACNRAYFREVRKIKDNPTLRAKEMNSWLF